MKDSIKNLSKQISSFFKRGVGSSKSTFKKHPKKFGFLAVLLIITPVTFVSATDWGVYDAFLSIILFIIGIFKTLATMVVSTAGLLFDNLLTVTLSVGMYDADWVKLGWSMIRDVANIAFIIGIVIIGIFMIIGRRWQILLLNLVTVAFIMNFSMFFGRVIIDAGNFTAAIFYSMSSVDIKAPGGDGDESETTSSFVYEPIAKDDRMQIAAAILGETQEHWKPYFGNRSIATGLIAFVDPTAMYSTEKFKERINADEGVNGTTENIDEIVKETKIMLDIVFILTMVFMSVAFIRAVFMFIARTIHLIKSIISAPIYFAWHFLPGGKSKLYEWFAEIVSKSFCVTSYMVGMWLLFLFLAADSKTVLDNIVEGKGVMALMALVLIKFFIIYRALNMLTDMGSKQCGDEGFGKGIADKFGAVAGFVGGGMLLKGGKIFGQNTTRGLVGTVGKRIGRSVDGLHDSKSGFKRYIGRLGVRAENKLYGDVKIGGRSFKDEVERSTKEDAHIDAILPEDRKKKRFYERMGGDNITYSKRIRTEEEIKERNILKEDISQKKIEIENMKSSGKYSDEDIKSKRKELAESIKNDRNRIKEKFGEDGLKKTTSEDRVKILDNNSHLLSDKSHSGLNNIQKGTVMGVIASGAAGVLPAGLAAAITGRAINLSLAENKEADRQYKKKHQLGAKARAEQKKLKSEHKENQEDYNNKRSKINLTRDKEKNSIETSKRSISSLRGVERLMRKSVEMEDAQVNGLNNLKNLFESGAIKLSSNPGDIAKIIDSLKESKFAENFKDIRDDDILRYTKSIKLRTEAEKKLDEQYKKLRDPGLSSTQKNSMKKAVEIQKDIVSSFDSDPDIQKVVTAFEAMADQQISMIKDRADSKHTHAKEYYEAKKKKVDDKLELSRTQLKENQEDIASGREARHVSKDNITKHVQAN